LKVPPPLRLPLRPKTQCRVRCDDICTAQPNPLGSFPPAIGHFRDDVLGRRFKHDEEITAYGSIPSHYHQQKTRSRGQGPLSRASDRQCCLPLSGLCRCPYHHHNPRTHALPLCNVWNNDSHGSLKHPCSAFVLVSEFDTSPTVPTHASLCGCFCIHYLDCSPEPPGLSLVIVNIISYGRISGSMVFPMGH
jgi:hypothetical protein